MCDDAVDGGRAPAREVRGRQQPDRQVGAGPLEADGVEPVLVEPARDLLELGRPLAPRCRRVVLVEPEHVDDLVAETRQCVCRRRAPGARRRPRRDRPRDHAPVRRLRVDHVEVLGQRRQLVAARHAGIDPVHQPRRCVRRDGDPRAVRLAQLQQPRPVPPRDELEGVGSAVVARMRLTCGSKYHGSTKTRAVREALGGDRTDERRGLG